MAGKTPAELFDLVAELRTDVEVLKAEFGLIRSAFERADVAQIRERLASLEGLLQRIDVTSLLTSLTALQEQVRELKKQFEEVDRRRWQVWLGIGICTLTFTANFVMNLVLFFAQSNSVSFSLSPFTVSPQETGHTLAKVLRSRLGGPSWTEVRKLIAARRVKVGDSVCSDDARRLKEDEVVVLLEHPKPLPRTAHPDRLVVRHLDEHVVVVEKPAGVNTVRHPAELEWSEQRRELDPTLEDLTQWAIAKQLDRHSRDLPRLRIVHRLDKETSGLVVFARSALAERELGLQFRKHTVVRRYLAVVPGILSARTIKSNLVPDRGDGRRGSTQLPDVGKEATTHVSVEERLPAYTILSCRLETGRTHQIRIHLSEAGHPVCGEKVYVRKPGGDAFDDRSEAPRLALHATELGFEHPASGEHLHWSMPLPGDLQKFVERLKGYNAL